MVQEGAIPNPYEIVGSLTPPLAHGMTVDLRWVEAELKRISDAVAAGAVVQTLLEAIKSREQERRDLLAKLEHLDGLE